MADHQGRHYRELADQPAIDSAIHHKDQGTGDDRKQRSRGSNTGEDEAFD